MTLEIVLAELVGAAVVGALSAGIIARIAGLPFLKWTIGGAALCLSIGAFNNIEYLRYMKFIGDDAANVTYKFCIQGAKKSGGDSKYYKIYCECIANLVHKNTNGLRSELGGTTFPTEILENSVVQNSMKYCHQETFDKY